MLLYTYTYKALKYYTRNAKIYRCITIDIENTYNLGLLRNIDI